MIITRTPFRISFFGGGTDLPAWYRQHGGRVLSTTIDKYCYVTCRYLPPFFEHKYRIVWTKTEMVKNVGEITHPVVRECIRHSNIEKGLEIHYDGDLPARAGMGTSSSFTVGLLNALYGLQGGLVEKRRLALEAIEIEQEKIKDTVGSQDQTAAAFGGLNEIEFFQDGQINVNPLILPQERVKLFKNHMLLFFTGFTRFASEIEKEKVKNFDKKQQQLFQMARQVLEAKKILESGNIEEFGKLLHETWQLKRSLSNQVSTSFVDKAYEEAKRAGALGGKLLGAGGGGFLLFFVKPQDQDRVREKLSNLLEIPFDFENSGSQVVFFKPEPY